MPVRVTPQPAESLRDDGALRAALRALCEPYYREPEAVLGSALQRSDRVLLARGEDETLEGFFCLAGHDLEAPSLGFERIEYGGLAVTRLPRRHRGTMAGLMSAWRDELRGRHGGGRSPLVCGITCHRHLLELAVALFTEVQPGLDRATDADGVARAELVCRTVFGIRPDPEDPFVLRSVTATRYRADFLARLPVAGRLRAWGVDETRGDRLLVVCRGLSGPATSS